MNSDIPSSSLFPPLISSNWPSIRHFVAGYFSGMALILVGHPLDTLKVRLQTEGSGRFRGPMHCFTETVKKEGFFGLYKGVTPPLFLTGVINAGVFGIQGVASRQIHRYRNPQQLHAAGLVVPGVTDTMLAAIPSGSIISFIVTPIEGVKSRLQVQYSSNNSLYSGPLDCVKSILRVEGIRGLYNGWSCVAFCRLSNYAYFGAYEFFKSILNERRTDKSKPLSSAHLMSCGGFAGISYWFSCYPIDLIKARLMVAAAQNAMQTRQTQTVAQPQNQNQTQTTNPSPIQPQTRPRPTITSIARGIYSSQGWRGFFVGFGPCLVRAFPANAAAFVTYETVMKLLPDKI